MTTAFILINTETGSEEEVKKKLSELEEVVEVYAVYGVYDLVVKLEAESKEHIKTGIFQKIRKINKIQSTMTMFVTE
ncbi:MAG: Lrp/AsnC family transcriptional regulator [Nitrososphaeria archaeon]|nr:Lrp/AsnC family transcriptional regulator [Nitrososphaeria archaeon]